MSLDRPAFSLIQGGASESGGARAEAPSFQYGHGLAHELRELNERWNNRLTIKVGALAKRYVEGRLSIICYTSLCPKGGKVESSFCVNSNGAVNDSIAVVINCAYARKPRDCQGWDKQLVLVDVVEFASFPNRKVPSFVRAYFVKDDILKIGCGFHCQSEMTGLCHSVPESVLRKMDAIPVLSERPDDVAGDVVEGHMQVVDRVADDQRDLGWQRLRAVPDAVAAGLRLLVHPKGVEVRFEESGDDRLQLVDVAYGPIDL